MFDPKAKKKSQSRSAVVDMERAKGDMEELRGCNVRNVSLRRAAVIPRSLE